MNFERVLALSPHTDDVELGAGGTIARLVEEGAKVSIAHFTTGTATQQEALAAGDVLGIESTRFVDRFETRQFSKYRQILLDWLVATRNEYAPDLVLCPSSFDFHQDHEVIRAEALRAFRTATILGYELPWSCRQFDAQCLVWIDERHLIRKFDAIDCYTSQATKPYTFPSFIKGLARVRGAQRGTEYAEAFEVIRWTM